MNRIQFLGLALLACTATAPAREFQLFVKNQPFDGVSRLVGRELFAPLDDLLRAEGCSWRLQPGSVVEVHSGEAGEGPPLTAVATLAFDGRPVHVNQHLYGNRVYVDVRQFAHALGSPYRLNLRSSTADLYTPLVMGSAAGELVRGNGDGRTSPVVLDQLSYALQDDKVLGRQALRGFAVVHNKGDKPVQGLVLRVYVWDAARRVVGRFADKVGTLAPGQSYTYQFPLWANFGPEKVEVKPTLELEHAP